jgi:hypothetical protein
MAKIILYLILIEIITYSFVHILISFYNHLGGRKELDIVEWMELQWMDFNGEKYKWKRDIIYLFLWAKRT